MSTVSGIDFVGLQVRDVAKSAAFYEEVLGLTRTPAGPPNAVVFDTAPIRFAVRSAEIDLNDVGQVGSGIALWFRADDSEQLHTELSAAGVPILTPPFKGPFGKTFTFADPDGYAITVHDKG